MITCIFFSVLSRCYYYIFLYSLFPTHLCNHDYYCCSSLWISAEDFNFCYQLDNFKVLSSFVNQWLLSISFTFGGICQEPWFCMHWIALIGSINEHHYHSFKIILRSNIGFINEHHYYSFFEISFNWIFLIVTLSPIPHVAQEHKNIIGVSDNAWDFGLLCCELFHLSYSVPRE